MNRDELKIEYMRGKGPGGQHRNKTNSACKITHIPTGITAYCDERDQKTSLRKATEEMQRRLKEAKAAAKASERKERRDEAIKPQATARTYDFKRGIVKDHRTGKEASVKDVLFKGRIELLR